MCLYRVGHRSELVLLAGKQTLEVRKLRLWCLTALPSSPNNGTGGHGLTDSLGLKISDLEIVDSTATGIVIQASVNFTNPTNYSATVPFVDISIEKNGSTIGHAQVTNAKIVPGQNTNIIARATWEPSVVGGKKGEKIGQELLSQYISGYNTTLTFRTNHDTIPHNAGIGEALSKFNVTIPTPRLSMPKDDDGDDGPEDPSEPEDTSPRFIKEATMHLLSSTAAFTLLSPFKQTTVYITTINATAFYQPIDPELEESAVGKILYDGSFAVRPGESHSPRLPVDWDLGGVGYEAVRRALGGTLKVRAEADVGVRIGEYAVGVWFRGSGIGAGVRL